MTDYWNRWSTTLYLLTVFLLITLLLAAAIMPVQGQEATPDAEPPVVVVATPTEQTISNVNTIVLGFILAFVAGGATVGGALMVFAKRLREQPELARAIERLYLSIPADQQLPIRQIVVGAKEGIDLAEELTDGDMNTPAGSSGAG